MEQIAGHLQLLEGKTRKEVFDILFNLAHINKEFMYLLSVTHSEHLRVKLQEAYKLVKIAPTNLTLKGVVGKLLEGKMTNSSSEVVYIIYKIVGHAVTPSMYMKLQAALGYDVQYIKEVRPQRELVSCVICAKQSTKSVCTGCTVTLQDFCECHREAFTVPLNYFNFKGIGTGAFYWLYKDWEISSLEDSSEVNYKLLPSTIDLPEQYSLPFMEYQKEILS